jgi:hypothetical protein
MAKKSKKAKAVAETNVAVEDVFGSPVGMNWEVGGIDPTKALDLTPKAGINWEEIYEAAEAEGGNGGPKEAKVEEKKTEIAVGGFNRNGMDFMMAGTITPETVVVNVVKVTKKSRVVIGHGYRGTVRDMLLNGATGEEIIKKIANMYIEKGGDIPAGFDTMENYGLFRGKRILQDMIRDKNRGLYGKSEVKEEVATP